MIFLFNVINGALLDHLPAAASLHIPICWRLERPLEFLRK